MTTATFSVAVLALAGAFAVLAVLVRRVRLVEESLQGQLHDTRERLAAVELNVASLAHTREEGLLNRERLEAAESHLRPLAAGLDAARDEVRKVREQLVDQVNAGLARVQDAVFTEVAAQVAASTAAFEYEGE
jgi:hypothetical protein